MPNLNTQWGELCDLTTKLFPQYQSRSRAFKAACEARPDLAAAAIDPTGKPVVPRSNAIAKRASDSVQAAAPASPGARPWSEIIGQMDRPKPLSAAPLEGSARPWRDVMRQIEAEERPRR
jgi:hypothetical protein